MGCEKLGFWSVVMKTSTQSSVKKKSKIQAVLGIVGKGLEEKTENSAYIYLDNCISNLQISKITLI